MLIVCFLRFLLFSIEGREEGRRILTRVNEEVSCIPFARLRYLIVSSGGGKTEAMKSGRHFSLNIFDVEVDAVCINLSWLFTYKKLHENTLFSNIYIYIYYTNQLYYRVYPMRIRCGSKNRTCVQNCTKSGMEGVAWSIVSRMFFHVRV